MIVVLSTAVIKASDINEIDYLQSDSSKYYLPVLMYHHMLKSSKLLGSYCITPTEFEQDLKYIKENGFTPISAQDLIDFVEKGVALPKKPIMITFDDGYVSNYVYAYPLLKEYNMKAIVSIIGNYTDLYTKTQDTNVNYSHLTWAELKEMQDSGLIEIGNHTYNLHRNNSARRGIKRLKGESMEQYTKMLTEDLTKLQTEIKENLGKESLIFAYPFGYMASDATNIINSIGFKVTFSCEEGINVLTGNRKDLIKLKRYNRPHNISTEAFFKKVLNKMPDSVDENHKS